MNTVILAGLAAGILVAGLIFSPLLTGQMPLSSAQMADTGTTREFTLIGTETTVKIAPDNALTPGGVMYNAMVFNGTLPGPPLVVNQGDTVKMTLKNEGKVVHSIDLHSAVGNEQVNSGPIAPGDSKSWTWKAVSGGAFMYHCAGDGLLGVWEHIANGMFGGVIVHAKNEKPAKEFYMVYGDMYYTGNDTTKSFDMNAFMAGNNNIEVTNGMAFRYTPGIGGIAKLQLNADAKPLMVKPGEQTRWYVVNGGPNQFIAFHFIAGQMDVRDGFVVNRLGTQEKNDETWTIPPGSASVIESVFPSVGPYVGVTHKLNDVVKGGAFVVMGSEDSTMDDIPPEAVVPKAGAGSPNSGGGNMTGGPSG